MSKTPSSKSSSKPPHEKRTDPNNNPPTPQLDLNLHPGFLSLLQDTQSTSLTDNNHDVLMGELFRASGWPIVYTVVAVLGCISGILSYLGDNFVVVLGWFSGIFCGFFPSLLEPP